MPTEKRRLTIVVDDWMWDSMESYRHERRLMSMSKVATELIEIGLKKEKAAIQKPEPRKLDEAKIRKHVKALYDLLSTEDSDQEPSG